MKSQGHLPAQWTPTDPHGRSVNAAIAAKINELSLLRTNWDGYGSPAIDPLVIEAAVRFVGEIPERLPFQPRVVPTSTGGLQFEWHDGPKVLELEFENPREIRYLRWHPQRAVEEEDSFPAKDIDRAVDLVTWFTSGKGV